MDGVLRSERRAGQFESAPRGTPVERSVSSLSPSLSLGSVLPTVFPVSRCEGTVRRSTVGGGGRKDRELLCGSTQLFTGLMPKCVSLSLCVGPHFNHNLGSHLDHQVSRV